MTAIPFPANVVLAPVTAAATFAGAMAFASFEHGGVVPQTGMAMVHKNEMYLGTGLSDFVRDAAGRAASSPAGAAHGGGDTHINYHAARGESPDQTTRNAAALKRMLRGGALKLA